MNWEEYEEITKYIYETLGSKNGVKIEGYGNTCKILGKSSVEHQIDVLTSHSDGLHTYKTAIECKYWKDTINKDIIMKVAEIVEDAGLNKGVIVSKNGFTPDAISFAKYRNIGLIELREPTEEDWKGRIKNIQINLRMLLPEVEIQFLVSKPNTESETIQIALLDIQHSGGKIESMEKYIEEFLPELHERKEGELVERIFQFEQGAKVFNKKTKKQIEINGFKIVGQLKVAKNDIVEIKGEDRIFMIMKSIFEDKSYIITKDKQIKERRK